MTVANRAGLLDMAVALLEGADAPETGPSRPGLRLVAPTDGGGEPVRLDRRASGQGSFHLVSETAERARLLRAELGAARKAAELGWRTVALGPPIGGPEESAELDLEIALEERPAALVSLGWFPEADGGAAALERDAAYIQALTAAARAARAHVWGLAASRTAQFGLAGSAIAPESPEPAALRESVASAGAPLAFRVLLIA